MKCQTDFILYVICNYGSIVNSLKVGDSEEGVLRCEGASPPRGAIRVLRSEDIQVYI